MIRPEPQSASETVKDALGEAARRAGIGQVAPGEVPTGRSLLGAVGGVRGIVEAILPGLGFLVVYAITKDVLPSVLAPLAVAAAFVIVRLLSRTPVTQAFAGVLGLAISAGLALLTGRAEDNFVPGFIINAVSILALLVSLAARWPLIGLIAGLLTNDLTGWRRSVAKRRVLTAATWLWVAVFGLRLAVQLPLYFASATEALAGTKLLMGLPLYAAALWMTWLLVRWVYERESGSSEERSSAPERVGDDRI